MGGTKAGHPKSYFAPYRNVPLEAEEGEHLTTRLTDEAIAGLDRLEPPFLMHLAYYTVHTPLQAAPERVAERMEAGVKGKKHATYAAMVEGLDAEFGRLMAALEERGLKESTLVLFTSDNGGLGGVTNTQPLRGFKGTLDEGGIRVPWMVRLPGRIAPRVDETPVHHADLLPTLAGIAGVEPEASVVDGADLGGLWFEGRPLAERALLWHFPVYLEGRSDRFPTWRTTPGCALRLGDTKLVEYFEDRLDGARRLELYDLDADPRESKDRADEDEERLKEMRDALDAALRRAGAKIPVTPAPQPESGRSRSAARPRRAAERAAPGLHSWTWSRARIAVPCSSSPPGASTRAPTQCSMKRVAGCRYQLTPSSRSRLRPPRTGPSSRSTQERRAASSTAPGPFSRVVPRVGHLRGAQAAAVLVPGHLPLAEEGLERHVAAHEPRRGVLGPDALARRVEPLGDHRPAVPEVEPLQGAHEEPVGLQRPRVHDLWGEARARTRAEHDPVRSRLPKGESSADLDEASVPRLMQNARDHRAARAEIVGKREPLAHAERARLQGPRIGASGPLRAAAAARRERVGRRGALDEGEVGDARHGLQAEGLAELARPDVRPREDAEARRAVVADEQVLPVDLAAREVDLAAHAHVLQRAPFLEAHVGQPARAAQPLGVVEVLPERRAHVLEIRLEKIHVEPRPDPRLHVRHPHAHPVPEGPRQRRPTRGQRRQVLPAQRRPRTARRGGPPRGHRAKRARKHPGTLTKAPRPAAREADSSQAIPRL